MVTITQLEYIIAVDKYKHFGKAATACSVSQPSLSIQIQKAEEFIGFIIFDRSKKTIVTTDLGEEYITQAKQVLMAHHRLGQVGQNNKIAGKFKLGIIPTLSPYITPLFIKDFSLSFPDVELSIIEAKTDDIKTMLSIDKLDGAILVTPLNDTRFIETFLFNEPFYLYASSELDFKDKVTANKLNPDTLWLLTEGNCFRNQVINLCSRGNSGPLKNVRFEGGSLETLVELVDKSGGCTVIPHLCMEKIKKTKSKSKIHEFSSKTPVREVSFIRSRSFMKEGIINSLVDSVKSKLPDKLQSNQSKINIIQID